MMWGRAVNREVPRGARSGVVRSLCRGKPVGGKCRQRLCREKRFVMTVSEIVRVEQFKIERFMALGLSRYEAIRAVEDGIDCHAVDALLTTGCALPPAV